MHLYLFFLAYNEILGAVIRKYISNKAICDFHLRQINPYLVLLESTRRLTSLAISSAPYESVFHERMEMVKKLSIEGSERQKKKRTRK